MARDISPKKSTLKKRPLAVAVSDGQPFIFYQLLDEKESRLCFAGSPDGTDFGNVCEKVLFTNFKKTPPETKNCRDFKISKKRGGWFLTYVEKTSEGFVTHAAESTDLKKWKEIETDGKIPDSGFLVPNFKWQNKNVLYYGKQQGVGVAYFKDLKTWETSKTVALPPRSGFFDNNSLLVLAVEKETDGIYVIYDTSSIKGEGYQLQIGAAVFSLDDPEQVIWRSEWPLFEQNFADGAKKKPAALGGVFLKDQIALYWWFGDKGLITVALPRFSIFGKTTGTKGGLVRKKENPIITPNDKNHWESEATFNPAALYEDGKVHLLYRAVGRDSVSSIGHTASNNGVNFLERGLEPAYWPREKFEGVHASRPNTNRPFLAYTSGGGGNGGCEDPRLTLIGNTVYMIYTAFDGWSSLRLALSSIKLADFKNQRWHWKKPILISPPGQIHKNWVLFPEKINGKFALLNSVSPEISVSYFDNLNFKDGKFVDSRFGGVSGRTHAWDNSIRGAGPPPIKTPYGWLLLYHAMDRRDPNRYKIGAMILDEKDPTKILYRSRRPILEPDMPYENEGFKIGVVYSCGAIVKDNELLIYYGGADQVSCVASAPFDKFLNDLRKDAEIKMVMRAVRI